MLLNLLTERVAICKLPPETAPPAWAWQGDFCSVSLTKTELSIVTAETNIPADIPCDKGWRVLSVAGTMDLTLTGILVSLAEPLARAGVNIFSISTYDTDHLLVPDSKLADAITALKSAGYEVTSGGDN